MVRRRTAKLTCSIGICVHNEAQNIESLLKSLLNQKLKGVLFNEIIIIASGSTDNTIPIVKSFQKRHKIVKLIRERRRNGKASAVNRFIVEASNDILVLIGGDLLLSPHLIQRLVKPFQDSMVGMTGGRPIPVNSPHGLTGRAAHLMWDLHHRIALISPKMGEAIVFRKVFQRVPPVSGADEASIEPLIRGQGYAIVYVPKAIVHNKAPETIQEFIMQRRRNYCLHLIVKHEQRYIVSTLNSKATLSALYTYIQDNWNIKSLIYIPFILILEAYCRLLGWWDYRIAHKRHTVWDIVHSTKNLGRSGRGF